MILVADESVDFLIIQNLRQKGITVISISKDYSGLNDVSVLNLAYENNCILITEDKDFGELAFRLNYAHKGILLIRLSDIERKERIEIAVNTVEKYFDKFKNNFSVVTKRGLRIKTTPQNRILL